MASISRRNTGGKPRYDVNYREPDGRARRRTFTRKVDAEIFRATVEADKARGTYLDPDAGRITFKAYAEQWLANQSTEPTTTERVQGRLRVHVYPVLGSKWLSQIKPSTIQAWLAGLTGAASTRRVALSTVSTILSAAVDDERIAKNPCKAGSVSPPRRDVRRIVPWSAERVGDVMNELSPRYQILVALGAGLGLRQGEIFGLSPDDVDFLRGTVTVRRQVRQVRSRLVFAAPKANKTRTVPLPSSVRDALAAYLALHPAAAVTLPWSEPGGEPVEVSLVARGLHGSALNRNSVNHYVWKPALRAAGVEPTRENGMHALRHHYASVLLDAGESIKAVSEYLGHTDAGFTLRVYTHLMPSSAERTRLAVDQALGCYISGTSGLDGPGQTAPDLRL
ncbi:site-specific integrase [Nocardioides mangrovicus]|uniref:Site-specific integrase n=1 Tax=Nocardioides mangrovicus TaxID=2478913 RepID=A0A3L8P3W1_9ACTN|nr:site-specific integrase [Nocardioides mangrovicus]RLV49722.1 site-specific integrase [Nocardioides mangrovicus]